MGGSRLMAQERGLPAPVQQNWAGQPSLTRGQACGHSTWGAPSPNLPGRSGDTRTARFSFSWVLLPSSDHSAFQSKGVLGDR